MDQEVAARSVLGKFGNAREALAAHNAMFMFSRYPFEPQSTLEGIEMGALLQLIDAIGEAISKMTPRHEPSTP